MRFVLVLAIVAACGEPALQLEDYATEYANAWCAHRVRCGVFRDVAACLEATRPEPLHPDTVAAVDAGTLVFHADVAQACIDRLATLGCDPTTADYRQSCWGVFTGTRRAGEVCAFGSECVSRECWKGDVPCTEACCIGECVGDEAPVPGQLGDYCRYAPCAYGRCEDSVCVPFRREGEACFYSSECDYGLSCHFGWCKALPSHGEPCIDACRELGQVCGVISNVCVPARLEGQTCAADRDCSPEYECRSDGLCALPGIPLGERCEWYERCADDGAFCDLTDLVGSEGVCALRKPDGAPCYHNHDCQSWRCNPLGACSSEPCI